jgi:hypothetical protein
LLGLNISTLQASIKDNSFLLGLLPKWAFVEALSLDEKWQFHKQLQSLPHNSARNS